MSKPPHNQRGVRPTQDQQQVSTRVEVKQVQWAGPLPHPNDLARFNEIIPGGADRIVAMAEKEQAHRLAYEASGLEATTQEAKRGQYLGTGISILAVCGAVYVAYIGAHWGVSVALVGIPVLGIVRAIVKPRPQGQIKT